MVPLDGQATGADWRTAPLWGIGLTAGVSGGEGQSARNNFANMNSTDRNALLTFLRSLQSAEGNAQRPRVMSGPRLHQGLRTRSPPSAACVPPA
ncbi:di-heme oxidoredictase family protein [Myxococcus sp. AB056]|uniref:di-heme oxidoredictase family protein n=1 Tax=Myxococcus sp. AB056 TaxID=2562792 RepID=UPI0034CFE1BA